MPHGYCYLWDPGLVWLHVVSDALIALSYFAIPGALLWFVRKRRDVPFHWMFLLFGVFIIACGATHAIEIWNLWHANYWLAGVVKAVTAAASIPTAILLVQLVPRAVELPSPTQWMPANAALEREVRERRDLELSLRASEAAYREQAELLDLTHDAIIVVNLKNEIIFWNRAAERLYGWPKEEVHGKIVYELLQTRFPKPLPEIESEIYKSGYWEGELMHRRRDGSEVIVSSRWALRRDDVGDPIAILQSNRDITRRKQEEEKFRNLLESAPDAFVIVDDSGHLQLVNAQTEKLFGYTRKELLGQAVEMLIPERFRERHVGFLHNYSKLPTRRTMGSGLELYGRRKDGTEFPVEISLGPLTTEEGILISSAIRDVTERRQAEEKIQGLNTELNRKLVELGNANKELESFSYSVSHDLRAPLRHIDGFARILKEEHGASFSEDGRHYLDRILHAVTQMGNLVDDLLNLARIGRKEIVPQKVKLDVLVRQVMADLPPNTENRNIDWRIGPLPEVEGDPGLLKLVLSNLLSNAAKFTRTRQAAVIEIGTREANGVPVFFVRDNGVGFDPRYADKLFGVFQRLHRQEDFEGTGVGLATVHRIIHKHGGKTWAESQPDRGATFFFTIGHRPAELPPDGAKGDYRG